MIASHLATLALASASLLVTAAPLRKRDGFSDLIASLTLSTQGTKPVTVSKSDQTTLGFSTAASLAAAAYCEAAADWSCPTCSEFPDMQILHVDGDGGDVPRVFVGYSASLAAVVVSHEGSENNLEAWIGNLDFNLDPLDPSLDNGDATGVMVHGGFQENFLAASEGILAAVTDALDGVASDATHVLLTGHSLGGAQATLTAIHLRLNLPKSMPLQVITFATPRVGSPAFADYVEAVLGTSIARIVHNNDIVPRIPGTWLGFSQTITEFWSPDNTGRKVVLCPGTENDACSAGVSDFDLSADPHNGPYYGVRMGHDEC